MLVQISELNLGYSDAQNYSLRKNKNMFNEVFVKNQFLEDLIRPETYFLIGEKGTGKTAYATYLSNSDYKNNKATIKFISNTDYEKFYRLKELKHICLSDYTEIWKLIILLILSQSIADDDILGFIKKQNTLININKAIKAYYHDAFTPEILTAMKIFDKAEVAAKLVSQYASIEGGSQSSQEFTEERFQMNIYYLNKQFSDCLASIRLKRNIVLFIDGIDIRPACIPYSEYIECIRGLASACWVLNNSLFQSVRDTSGNLKVAMLLRPDIFNALELQNSTNKIIDNSVYLDWNTTYVDYLDSHLFRVSEKLLQFSQSDKSTSCWDSYFDWKISSTSKTRQYDTAFMSFLKISLSRPRDIQRIISIIKQKMVMQSKGHMRCFDYSVYNSDLFQNAYSEYFLGSLKDQLAFYYSEDDFKHFKHFLALFNRSGFSFQEYQEIYKKYIDYIFDNAKEIPEFVDDPKRFMQLLYDSNVVCAVESINNNKYFHFSYREKCPTNISPEVPYSENVEYIFHYGLYKESNWGRF